MKQWVPITDKSSKFKGATQHYVVKLPKSAGARYYCPKVPRVPGTLGTRSSSSHQNHWPCTIYILAEQFVYKGMILEMSVPSFVICNKKFWRKDKSIFLAYFIWYPSKNLSHLLK